MLTSCHTLLGLKSMGKDGCPLDPIPGSTWEPPKSIKAEVETTRNRAKKGAGITTERLGEDGLLRRRRNGARQRRRMFRKGASMFRKGVARGKRTLRQSGTKAIRMAKMLRNPKATLRDLATTATIALMKKVHPIFLCRFVR